jgi:imidazoleglycerol-phosphate dehydratase
VVHVDVHHLAEDCGIVLGQAVAEALGDRLGIERYGDAFVPMDETLAHVVVDLSGRPFLAFEPAGFEGNAGGFNAHHLRELLRGFCNHAGATVHVRVLSGVETHHVCEAVVKAFARSLALAVAVTGKELPSTKGLL